MRVVVLKMSRVRFEGSGPVPRGKRPEVRTALVLMVPVAPRSSTAVFRFVVWKKEPRTPSSSRLTPTIQGTLLPVKVELLESMYATGRYLPSMTGVLQDYKHGRRCRMSRLTSI